MIDPNFGHALGRSLVLGLLAGIALVLVSVYSNRGPLILPVYAALLVLVGLLLTRFHGLTLGARFIAVLGALLTSSAALLMGVIVLSNRDRKRLARLTSPPSDSFPPRKESKRTFAVSRSWLFLALFVVLALLSTAVAFVSS